MTKIIKIYYTIPMPLYSVSEETEGFCRSSTIVEGRVKERRNLSYITVTPFPYQGEGA
ncbi:hypothetical protein ACFLTO_00665 [Chloroflexota bacterium]